MHGNGRHCPVIVDASHPKPNGCHAGTDAVRDSHAGDTERAHA
jgi:hypothetical protein